MFNVPAELTLRVTNRNTLLAQLAASCDREKRFVSDAAHELRMLISALKVTINNLRHNLCHRFGANENFKDVADNIRCIAQLIGPLLLFSRPRSETLRADFSTVPLEWICQRLVSDRYR